MISEFIEIEKLTAQIEVLKLIRKWGLPDLENQSLDEMIRIKNRDVENLKFSIKNNL
jgi:hypothetical protein